MEEEGSRFALVSNRDIDVLAECSRNTSLNVFDAWEKCGGITKSIELYNDPYEMVILCTFYT